MPSRLLRPALLAAVVLTVAVPSAAWAADAVLREPSDGVVTGASRLLVQVAVSADDRAERIDATLRDLDGELAPDARHPLCQDATSCSRERADYPIEFDPRSGAPFLTAEDAQILANGDYVVRLVVTRADDMPGQTLDLPLVVSAPGTAPADVQATADDGEVLLSWELAPEPDVTGYYVERATETGWSLVAEVPSEATSLVDAPGTGVHAYRVVTLRPDGRGATYETVSREVSVEVAGSDDPPVGADQPGAEVPSETADGAPTSPGSTPTSEITPGNGQAAPGQRPTDDPAPEPAVEAPGDASAPAPSLTSRTVSEGGGHVLGTSTATTGRVEVSPWRFLAPVAVGLVFVGLAVRVWRQGRPVHRPPV